MYALATAKLVDGNGGRGGIPAPAWIVIPLIVVIGAIAIFQVIKRRGQ